MDLTTMGALCELIPQDRKDFFQRTVDILDDTYPDGWRSWGVKNVSYSDLFGKSISPAVEAKLRFAVPTARLALAYSPDDCSLSEKKYRIIKRMMLQWPLGRALLYAPHKIMEEIHQESYDVFMHTVKTLKPQLTSVRGNSPRKRSSLSPQPGCSSAAKTPRRESDPSDPQLQQSFFEKMVDLLANQTQAIEGIAAQISTLSSRSEQSIADESESDAESTLSDTNFSAPSLNVIPKSAVDAEDTQEALLTTQIAEAEKKLAALKAASSVENLFNYDFTPSTVEAEPKLAKADHRLVEQGRRCQRLNDEGWKNVRYAEVQKTFHATPVFGALKVNNLLATSTPSWNSTAQLEKTDLTLGAITHGLLLQRKAFQEICKTLDAKAQQDIQKHLLAPDSTFRKISDGLLQYTCGRRAEIIQLRREIYKSPNKILNEILHDIPPSDTHLFDDEKLSEVVKNQGGAHKFFPRKTTPGFKTGKKPFTSKGQSKSQNGKAYNRKQPPMKNFRPKQETSGNNNKPRTGQNQNSTKKP
ncbi:uncharacterized protein LOC126379470 [Pectinophora gossypiella]|uniref:uncharacterized protein LOC126366831 n=1 Tax=Pectinophora gossypiella TaxID=13191 RepID=UPI00214E2E26|nr:uncharacterized protein LOC126366831 [Pectinophora gossypiella]XP_049884187.1 uncharacterized protein LOC126379470 [Pectinophora gossypiella]